MRKFGTLTATAMVVGIVIGSGIFYKTQTIHAATAGNVWTGALAWLIGGIVMLCCAAAFADAAANGAVGISNPQRCAAYYVGIRYGGAVGCFLRTVYYPALAAILAWMTARYLGELMQFEETSPPVVAMAALLAIAVYLFATRAKAAAGRLQIVLTIAKLIPLAAASMAACFGSSVTASSVISPAQSGGFGTSLISAAFAYDGWIAVTAVSENLRNARRSLPIALLGGGGLVIVLYLSYHFAIGRIILPEDTLTDLYRRLFGSLGGYAVAAAVIISCLGTLNGLTLACAGAQKDPRRGLLLTLGWLSYFVLSLRFPEALGAFVFDITELPAVTLYALFLPIFIGMYKRRRKLAYLAIPASLFMLGTAAAVHRSGLPAYLVLLSAVCLIGALQPKMDG